jgi:trimeric autotransporter adhesin
MKNKFLACLLLMQVLIAGKALSQNIAVNATGDLPDTSAMLDVSSTVKGFLAPRMTTTQRNAIPLPATGLLIYNTTTNAFNVNVGTPSSPSWTAVASGATTNTLGSSGNTITSTVNGVAATANAVNSVSNTSSANNLSTTVNGVTGSNVSIINSNALSLSGTNLTSTVNGVASSALDLSGIVGTSAWLKTGNSGITAAHFIGTTNNSSLRFRTNNTERMVLDSNGRVGIGTTAPESDLTILQSSGTGNARGIRFTGNSIGGTSSGTGFGMSLGYNIANNKQLWLGDADYFTNVNGTFFRFSASNGYCIMDAVSGDNTVRRSLQLGVGGDGNSAIVLGSDLNSTAPSSYIWGNGNMAIGNGYRAIAAPTNGLLVQGNVGIGQTAPGSALDVKGTLRLSGSTSGYVGFAPAAAAGSTTYTLPTADGSSGQVLTTNGSATLSWTSASNDWTLTGNGSTNASTNFIGTTNAVDFVTRTNNTERMRILSGGNVGINTTTPGSTLDVKGTLRLSGSTSGYVGFAPAAAAGSTTYTLPTADGSSGQVLTTNGSATLSWTSASNDWTLTGNGSTNASTNFIGTTNAVDFVTRTNNTERLRVTSAGKIGIGTTTPNYSLHIHDATVSPSGGTWMQISNNASGSGTYDGFYYGVNASGAPEIWAENNLDIVTGSGSTNKYTMRLTPAGNVGINTLTPGSSLDVKGTIRLSGSSSGYVGFAPAAAAGSTTYTLPSADGSNGQVLTTNGSGTLSWSTVSGGGGSGWSLTGNSGTNSSTNYIGTSDYQALVFKVNGTQAGFLGPSGNQNVSFGLSAAAGYQGVAIGQSANANSGNEAVAIGNGATATSYRGIALGAGSTASTNNENLALGYGASATAYRGTAIGYSSSVSSANYTLAVGSNTSASAQNASAFGYNASATGQNATAIGTGASATGQNATALGNGASATATNSTAIGNGAVVSTNNYISIGNTSVQAIRGQVAFSTYSDGRFKTNVKENVPGLEFITKLRPVTYTWDIHKFNAHARGNDYPVINAAYNPDEEAAIRKKESITYTGFIAQEVDKAAQETNFNFSGVLKPVDDKDAYSVSYADFVVPLVKAAQELNNKLNEQQKVIEALQQEIIELKKKKK